jgi:hypothetical protein
MRIQVDVSALRRTKWHEYILRFLFGGAVTVMAGLIAHKFGPVLGGVFLAVPAIFPASATLIEKHEKEKKKGNQEAGVRKAGFDAEGAALGCIGLAAFAIVVWKFLPTYSAWVVLLGATLGWLLVATLMWKIRMTFTPKKDPE